MTAVGAALLLLNPGPAQATSARTWVASNGTNNATCSRATPCQTFDQAHNATSAGGEINCVDAANYGPVTITKSLTIACDNTEASIFAATGSITINVLAGASDIVILKGIDIEGAGSGVVGIDFFTGGALHLHKVKVRRCGFLGVTLVSGLLFQPTGNAELYVTDSIISDNGGTMAPTAGILMRPRTTGTANVFINRTRLENNATGIPVDGTQTTGVAVNAVVKDSVVTGSAGNGIVATTAAAKAAVSVVVNASRVVTNFGRRVTVNAAAPSGAGSAIVQIGNSIIAQQRHRGERDRRRRPAVVQEQPDLGELDRWDADDDRPRPGRTAAAMRRWAGGPDMNTTARTSVAFVGAMFALVLHAAPARATSDRTWVSGSGTSNVTCDRTTPCQTFQQAHDATNPGGRDHLRRRRRLWASGHQQVDQHRL